MVEVATKKAKNPIAVVANKLNMPSVAESQPFLPLPGKLIIPRSLITLKGSRKYSHSYSSYKEDHYSILGLGDIVSFHCQGVLQPSYQFQVLPGLLVCLAMRFDQVKQPTSPANGPALSCSKWTYFLVTITGYCTGNQTTVATATFILYQV